MSMTAAAALLVVVTAVVLTWPAMWRQAGCRVSAVHGSGEGGRFLIRVTWPDGRHGTGALCAAWRLGAGVSLLALDARGRTTSRAVPGVVAVFAGQAAAPMHRAVQRAIGSLRAD